VPDDNADLRRLSIIEAGIKASRASLREKEDKLALNLMQIHQEIEDNRHGITDYSEPAALTDLFVTSFGNYLFGVPEHLPAVTKFAAGLNSDRQQEFLTIGVTALLRHGHDMPPAALAKTVLDTGAALHVKMSQELESPT
jgi:hypothetical protein